MMSSTESSETIRLSDDLCYPRADLYKDLRQCPVYPSNLRNPFVYAQYTSKREIDGRKKSSALARAFNWYTQDRGPSVSSPYSNNEPYQNRVEESDMRGFSEWLDRKYAEYYREKMVSKQISPASFNQREQRRNSQDPKNRGDPERRNTKQEYVEYILRPKQLHCNRSTLHPPDRPSCSTVTIGCQNVCKPILKSHSCVATMSTKQSYLLNGKPSQPPSSDERQLNVVSMDGGKCTNIACTGTCSDTDTAKRFTDAMCQNSMSKLRDAQVQYEKCNRKDCKAKNKASGKNIKELWVLPKNKFGKNGSDDYVKDCSCCANYYTNNLTLLKPKGYKLRDNNFQTQTSNDEVDLKDMCNGPFVIRFLQVQEDHIRR